MTPAKQSIRVDADVHPPLPPIAELIPHLPARWREFARTSQFASSPAYANAYPKGARTSVMQGAGLAAGAGAAAGLDNLRRMLLEPSGVDVAILNCYYGVEILRHPDWAAALATAVNEWIRQEWLEKDTRLRASIVVDPKYPSLAAREVERAAQHPGFVQVLVPARADRPYGNREYDPLLAAINSRGLVLGIHFGGFTGNATTSVGWPTYYFEEYVGMVTAFQVQVLSLVAEGAFERNPGLRVALIEGGWTWLPPVFWRMDKEWKGLRRETPWVTEPPSSYVRKHMRATLQPIDAPVDREILDDLLGQLAADDLLMFSSDYPHETGSRAEAYLELLEPSLRDRVLGGNAAAFYDLGRGRAPVDGGSRARPED
jgi:predicted TIM-barrel fold metal-dependent hydrolase